ncbi:glycosyltransferase [Microbacterium sp. LS_15]|uniref:glycosyltransferase n=1 Tax=Microbacterium sp. LS_15 TaxID=3055790 RepID=UPI0035BF2563
MRVLVVHPGAELYGADRVTLESAAGLVAAGHDVVAVLPESGPLVAELEGRGVRVTVARMFVLRKHLLRPRHWPTLLSSAIGGLIGSWRVISRHRPDAAYVSTVILPQWPPLLRLRRVPTVTHVHEAESDAPWPVRAVLYSPQLWAHAVIANSRFTAEMLRQSFPALRRRTAVILNPIAGPDAPAPLRDRIDDIRIGYVGRLSPRKAPDAVVSAVAALRERGRDARLDVVGDVFRGYEWYAAELQEQIDAGGLAESITLHGYDADVWPHLAECDLMIVPSRTDESFGNTAVEAVLAGRPVVVSDLAGLREAVGGYPTARTAVPGDAATIADAVESIVDDWTAMVAEAPDAAAAAAARHSAAAYHRSVTAMIRRVAGREESGEHGDVVAPNRGE